MCTQGGMCAHKEDMQTDKYRDIRECVIAGMHTRVQTRGARAHADTNTCEHVCASMCKTPRWVTEAQHHLPALGW